MSHPQSYVATRDDRYAIAAESDVAAWVEFQPENRNSPQLLKGQVRHLSCSGLRLVLAERLPQGTALQLKLDIDTAAGVFSSDATVRHTQVRADGQFWTGCSLEDRIPDALLEQLAVDGHLDRREASRLSLSQSVTVHRELGKGTLAASIENLSANGCCLLTADPVQQNERLRLEVDHSENAGHPVHAAVKWHRPSGEGSLVGCVFLGKDGYKRMQECLPDPNAEATAGSSRWRWLAAAALVGGLVWAASSRHLLN